MLKKRVCPSCQKATNKHHCGSPYCIWYLCGYCQTPRVVVVFTTDQRFFRLEKQ